MSIDQVLLTAEERARLKAELDELVNVRRPDIAGKIGRAAADGDLSENGAYHHAKEQQGHLEGRIGELEYLLRNAVVVEPTSDVVGFGSTVHITDDQGKPKTYQLVSKHSARPSEGLISDESPIGHALLGKGPGETVEYGLPNGQKKSVTIKSVG